MASEDHSSDKPHNRVGTSATAKGTPDWAGGLKQLYDAVVEEPLPDAFMDLLNRLDQGDNSPLPDGKTSSGGASDQRS